VIEAAAVVLFCGGYIALLLYGAGRWRRETVKPDPALQERLQAALGPLPEGLSLTAARIAGPLLDGTRLVMSGLCPELHVTFDPVGADPDAAAVGDARILAHGPRALVSAFFQEAARSAWLELAACDGVAPDRLQLFAGELRVDVAEHAAARPGVLERVARAARSAATLLRAAHDVPARLAENVASDPVTAVRLASLDTLGREFAGHASTQAALRAAAGSDVAELRLEAGRLLGEAGRPVLIGLLDMPGAGDSTCASAVDALRVIPTDLAATLLLRALARDARGIAASLTARSVIDALRRAGVADAALLAEAVRSPAPEVALEAVGLLADAGSAAAVPALQDAAAHHPSDEVRRRARLAVADVQSRLPDAAPGQLSLDGGASGAVSLAAESGGQVSLAGTERGQKKP